jgi:hypothetical protein
VLFPDIEGEGFDLIVIGLNVVEATQPVDTEISVSPIEPIPAEPQFTKTEVVPAPDTIDPPDTVQI